MSTSLDGSISFYSITHNRIIGSVNLEGSIRDIFFNEKYQKLIVLVSDSYFYFLDFSERMDLEGVSLDFSVKKSFELTKAHISNIFSEEEFLFMRNTLGLVHRLDISEICLNEADLSEEEMKKREKMKKKRRKKLKLGSFPLSLLFLTFHLGRNKPLPEEVDPHYVDFTSLVSNYIGGDDILSIDGFNEQFILLSCVGNQVLLVDKSSCKTHLFRLYWLILRQWNLKISSRLTCLGFRDYS